MNIIILTESEQKPKIISNKIGLQWIAISTNKRALRKKCKIRVMKSYAFACKKTVKATYMLKGEESMVFERNERNYYV